jgi:hypothetical protein
VGRSTGSLRPPSTLVWSAGGGATLRWVNVDHYDRIVIERLVDGFGAARVLAELPGDVTSYTDAANLGPTAIGATYSYRLRCQAGTAGAFTRVEGVVGAP